MYPAARQRVEEIAGSFEIHVSYGAENIAREKKEKEVIKRHIVRACAQLLKDVQGLHRCWHADEPTELVEDMPFDDSAEDLIFHFRSELAEVLRRAIQDHRKEEHKEGVGSRVSAQDVGEYISHFIMDEGTLRRQTKAVLAKALREAMVQAVTMEERRQQDAHDPLEEAGNGGSGE